MEFTAWCLHSERQVIAMYMWQQQREREADKCITLHTHLAS